MNIRRRLLPFAALLALTAPANAQTAAPALTPPAVLGAAKTIQFTATYVKGGHRQEFSVAYLELPNKAFVQDTDAKTKKTDIVYASDGRTQTEYRRSRGHYTQSGAPASLNDAGTHTLALSALADFIDPAAFAKFSYLSTFSLHRDEKPLTLYTKWTGQDDKGWAKMEQVVVDPVTGLPKELEYTVDVNGPHDSDAIFEDTARIEFSGWKLNQPLNDALFRYTPPATATLYTPPNLLADGMQAPDFTANDKDGKPVKLSDYKGKVVVLDFWATWCGPCQASLPHTTTMAKQYADRGVTVLAVNVWDKPDAFQAWLPKHPQYAALRFAIDPALVQDRGIATGLYGVSGIPTQYVIGRDGRIVKSIVGYDEGSTALEDALKAAGAG